MNPRRRAPRPTVVQVDGVRYELYPSSQSGEAVIYRCGPNGVALRRLQRGDPAIAKILQLLQEDRERLARDKAKATVPS